MNIPNTDEAVTLHGKVEQLERTVALLEAEVRAQRSARSRSRVGRWIALALLGVGGVASAQLVTFTADTPARASQVNANFTQLRTWLEQKVGTVGSANISTAGSVTAASGTVSAANVTATGTLTAASAVVSAYRPPYAAWPSVVGAGGAGIVNDNGSYKKLMVVGNSSDNGSTRVVGIWDDLHVAGQIDIGLERKACLGIASGATCSCPTGKRLLGGGAYCSGDNNHVNTTYPVSDTGWQAWCETSSGTNLNVDVYILCARVI